MNKVHIKVRPNDDEVTFSILLEHRYPVVCLPDSEYVIEEDALMFLDIAKIFYRVIG